MAIDEHVLNWIHARRDNRLRVSRKLIMRLYKRLYTMKALAMMSVQNQHLLLPEVGWKNL